MKLKLLSVLMCLMLACGIDSEVKGQKDSEVEVYVCAGSSASCYHRIENCRGLSLCASKVTTVSERSAQILGRRQCKICYKKTTDNE